MILDAITSPNWNVELQDPVAVFLHGYGSNEYDLTGLASTLPEGMRWASLRAPIPIGARGHAWFHIGEPGHPDPSAVAAATDAIWSWVGATLPASVRLVPIGFSQGGLMASQLLRTDPARVLAPVILSGFVLGEEQLADAQLREARPAVFCGRGGNDQVIASAAVERTNEWLLAHTTPMAKLYPGLAHGIDAPELADVKTFLTKQLEMVNR